MDGDQGPLPLLQWAIFAGHGQGPWVACAQRGGLPSALGAAWVGMCGKVRSCPPIVGVGLLSVVEGWGHAGGCMGWCGSCIFSRPSYCYAGIVIFCWISLLHEKDWYVG